MIVVDFRGPLIPIEGARFEAKRLWADTLSQGNRCLKLRTSTEGFSRLWAQGPANFWIAAELVFNVFQACAWRRIRQTSKTKKRCCWACVSNGRHERRTQANSVDAHICISAHEHVLSRS